MRRNLRLAVALTVVLAMSLAACTSSTAYKATGVAMQTVDLAMSSWAEWVHAGKANAAQEEQVRKAYMAYQESLNVAEKATLAYYASANKDPNALSAVMQAVSQAAVSVVTIINSLRPTAPPIPVPTGGK